MEGNSLKKIYLKEIKEENDENEDDEDNEEDNENYKEDDKLKLKIFYDEIEMMKKKRN